MKITHFQVTSATTLNLDFNVTTPITIFRGRYSDLVLDLMREMLCDGEWLYDPNRYDGGRFKINADVEMDGKNYDVFYFRNKGFKGDKRLAVNYKLCDTDKPQDDTKEYVNKCVERDLGFLNVLVGTAYVMPSSDERPIFIYEYFDQLDMAIDVTPILDRLASLGRQVFISVCEGYPDIKHQKVEVISS
ncbi:MAG: hypothetical protein ACI4MQ_06660 [Candidatus Coproplasma sp.]